MTGAELQRRRQRLGLSRRQLADALGTTGNTVWRWEAWQMGIRYPALVASMVDQLERDNAALNAGGSGEGAAQA